MFKQKLVYKFLINMPKTFQELLKPGYVVQLISKLTGKSLRVLENGLLDCTINKGSACEFTIAPARGRNSAIKFQNVAQPQYYLAIMNGFMVGYVRHQVIITLLGSYIIVHRPPPTHTHTHTPIRGMEV